jgi:hypothetical protein
MDAWLHGTTKAGGEPSTVSATSRGVQRASMATMAVTAEANASAAEPIRRAAATPTSVAVTARRPACVAPANTIGASPNRSRFAVTKSSTAVLAAMTASSRTSLYRVWRYSWSAA